MTGNHLIKTRELICHGNNFFFSRMKDNNKIQNTHFTFYLHKLPSHRPLPQHPQTELQMLMEKIWCHKALYFSSHIKFSDSACLYWHFVYLCVSRLDSIHRYHSFLSPVFLIECPTLSDQPTGCTRGLCMWHQKSESTSPEGPSPPSSYSSLSRPPMTVSTTAKRVRLTCERSTTSTRTPCLNGHLKLSAIWNTYRRQTEEDSYADM